MRGLIYLAPTIVVLAIGPAAYASPATLAPIISLAGKPAGDKCRFEARQVLEADDKPHTATSEDGAAIEVPAGTYDLRVTCDGLTPPVDRITVQAGRSAKPKVSVTSTRLRIMATRSSKRIAAKVRLFPAGQRSGDALVEHDANLKFDVAEGRYDVFVLETKDDGRPASAWVPGLNVSGRAVTERKVDLSDGKLRVDVTDNGRSASASVRVYVADDDTEVGQVKPGETIALAPGEYTIVTTLLDAADFREDRQTGWIDPNATTKKRAAFTTGTLAVTVLRDGHPMDATVHLALPGAGEDFNFFAAPGTVSLSPGTYDVTIEPKNAGPIKQTRRTGVVIVARRKSSLRVDLTPAWLTVLVKKSNKRIVPNDVRVHDVGGGDEVAQAQPDGRFRLWPGRYEIVAVLQDGTELRDGPFSVKLGEKITRAVSFSRGTLSVAARRGDATADEAEVFVFRPGAKVPTARARAEAKIELLPGTYDIKVVAGHEWRWQQGIRIRDDQTTAIEVRFKPRAGAKIPDGERPPLGDEMPEGELPEGE